MTAREIRARGCLKFWLPSDGVRLRVYVRMREREKKESYIQNSWDKTELSDLAVAMVRVYDERSRKSTSGREDQEGGRYRL